MSRLLIFKHWHLFLLIFICGAWTSPSPLKEIINSIAVVTFSLWVYAIGVYGQERIAELGLKSMNVKLFKINVLIVSAFILAGLFYISNFETTQSDNYELADVPFSIAGLYLTFAIPQTIIFVAKTIAKIELRKEVTFGDYVSNLLLIFFFFIGVWILQPKVNKLIATNKSAAL